MLSKLPCWSKIYSSVNMAVAQVHSTQTKRKSTKSEKTVIFVRKELNNDKMSEENGKYINPLTDLRFKRLFGTEPSKLFEAAEIAKFTPKEREAYEESLKYYRDIKNVVDTSKQEGKSEVAKEMKNNGEPIEKIMKYTNLSREEIERL